MHPDLGEKKHLNMLMYIGRAKVLKRLDALHREHSFQAYNDYVMGLRAGLLGLTGSNFS